MTLSRNLSERGRTGLASVVRNFIRWIGGKVSTAPTLLRAGGIVHCVGTLTIWPRTAMRVINIWAVIQLSFLLGYAVTWVMGWWIYCLSARGKYGNTLRQIWKTCISTIAENTRR